jgi:hypothetical protein
MLLIRIHKDSCSVSQYIAGKGDTYPSTEKYLWQNSVIIYDSDSRTH